jgi:D-sedoheptulose 7-phosphate isomerase
MKQPAPEKVGGLEELYPFLYAGHSDLASVLQEVRRSTEEKVREIMALRDWLGHELASRLSACAQAMARAFRAQGKLFAFGNGGSSTDAQAVAQLFLHPPLGEPLPAFALTNDMAVVTALANDVDFDIVFVRQIAAFGRPGDIAVGISTSGNSPNVIRAFDEAARRGLLTVGLAGYNDGAMAEAASVAHRLWSPPLRYIAFRRHRQLCTTCCGNLLRRLSRAHRAIGRKEVDAETSTIGC